MASWYQPRSDCNSSSSNKRLKKPEVAVMWCGGVWLWCGVVWCGCGVVWGGVVVVMWCGCSVV